MGGSRGVVAKLAAEAAAALVFVVVVKAAMDWQNSAVRLELVNATERLRDEWGNLVDTLRFRNAVRSTLDNLDLTTEETP
jgi:hypothetical protein